MKRCWRNAWACAACFAIAATAVLPAGAARDDLRVYKGRIVGVKDSRVYFTIVPNEDADIGVGPPRVVDDLRVIGAPCALVGTGDTSFDGFDAAWLSFRSFSAYVDFTGGRGGSTYEAEGHLLRRGRVRGALDFHEEFDKVTTCDTGELRWRAHQIG